MGHDRQRRCRVLGDVTFGRSFADGRSRSAKPVVLNGSRTRAPSRSSSRTSSTDRSVCRCSRLIFRANKLCSMPWPWPQSRNASSGCCHHRLSPRTCPNPISDPGSTRRSAGGFRPITGGLSRRTGQGRSVATLPSSRLPRASKGGSLWLSRNALEITRASSTSIGRERSRSRSGPNRAGSWHGAAPTAGSCACGSRLTTIRTSGRSSSATRIARNGSRIAAPCRGSFATFSMERRRSRSCPEDPHAAGSNPCRAGPIGIGHRQSFAGDGLARLHPSRSRATGIVAAAIPPMTRATPSSCDRRRRLAEQDDGQAHRHDRLGQQDDRGDDRRQSRQRDRDQQVADRLGGDPQDRQPEQARRRRRQVQVAADLADDERAQRHEHGRDRHRTGRPARVRPPQRMISR